MTSRYEIKMRVAARCAACGLVMPVVPGSTMVCCAHVDDGDRDPLPCTDYEPAHEGGATCRAIMDLVGDELELDPKDRPSIVDIRAWQWLNWEQLDL